MKTTFIYLILIVSLINIAGAQDTLYIYGPGGPLGPIKECADFFSKQNGIPTKVVAGPENTWIAEAEKNADLVFGGAEYMMDDFHQRHPSLLRAGSRTSLYTRSAGLLVRPGNPKQVKSVADLSREGIRIMITTQAGQTAMWEELAIVGKVLPAVQRNICCATYNSAQAIEKWKEDPGIDVWITYASWHYRLKDVTELVTIPPEMNISRGTPIAITEKTDQPEAAERFVRFLLTPVAERVFVKWGWNRN